MCARGGQAFGLQVGAAKYLEVAWGAFAVNKCFEIARFAPLLKKLSADIAILAAPSQQCFTCSDETT